MTTINDPEYSDDAYENAVKHFQKAEKQLDQRALSDFNFKRAASDSLLGIGWALLAIAKKGI